MRTLNDDTDGVSSFSLLSFVFVEEEDVDVEDSVNGLGVGVGDVVVDVEVGETLESTLLPKYASPKIR